jgi:NADPH2:quinone reductase
VRAASVNHVDTVIRSGVRPYFKITPPHVLGSEAAGEIAAVGPEVSGWAVGDRVIANTKTGAYAELALAEAQSLLRMPAGMAFEDAAAFGSTGPTAYRLTVRRAQVRAGEVVLVTAAASGTGALILQIAKAAGAFVIATAGSPRKLDLVKQLGADATINHYEENLADRLAEITGGQGADVAIDAVSSQPMFEQILTGMRAGGRVVLYGNMAGTHLQFLVRTVFSKGLSIIGGQGGDPRVTPSEREIDNANLMRLAAGGQLKVLRDRVLPFAKAAEAHRALEAHEVAGKIILTP